MGIDWEYYLGAEGEDLQRAYEDSLFDPDPFYGFEDDFDYDPNPFEEGYHDGPGFLNFDIDDQDIATEHMLLNNKLLLAILKGTKFRTKMEDSVWTDSNEKKWPIAGNLFHANSVITSLGFIREGGFCSRMHGTVCGQTSQHSDDLDSRLGILNDIFFDNIDSPSYVKRPSVYGPIMFVAKHDILESQRVRIFKKNPWTIPEEEWDELSYSDIFFADSEELQEEVRSDRFHFLSNLQHHTTVYDTGVLDFDNNLSAIYVEKCPFDPGREVVVKELLENELKNAGIKNVPVVIREVSFDKEKYNLCAAPVETLWELPESYREKRY